ncbi:MAG: nucleotide exchange factor GrpE [Treponema sp.]|nr:nucleotide exchange factor GrpE [Treponema sp.]
MSKHIQENNQEEAAGGPAQEAAEAAAAEAGALNSPEPAAEPTAVPTEPAPEAAPTAPLGPEEKIAALEAQAAELNDQYLRKAADFENFRKRMNREKQELVDFANQNLLLDLLPIIDDFERAIKSAEVSQDFAGFYEGINMIEKRLTGQLESKWGLKRFESQGEPFDPNRHEALQMEKAAGVEEPVVSEDFLKGYLLKDRVLRFAKVKVLMPEERQN